MSRRSTSDSKTGKAPAKKSKFSGPRPDPFTPEEIIRVAAANPAGGWLSPQEENAQTDRMKEFKMRYVTILCKGIDSEGKARPPRPLNMTQTSHRTCSKAAVKYQPDNKGVLQPPASVKYAVRIDFPNDFKDEKEFNETMSKLADDEVNAKFPGCDKTMSQEEFEKLGDQQEALFKREYTLKKAWVLIAREWERMLSTKTGRAAWGWVKDGKQHCQSNIQWSRKPTDEEIKKGVVKPVPSQNEEDDDTYPLVPLEQPLARFKLQVNRADGAIWCRIFDTLAKPKAAPGKTAAKVLATMKNPKTGKAEVINLDTIEEYLTPTSVVVGDTSYQGCFCAQGALLHATMKEMHVRRAAKMTAGARVAAGVIDSTDDYGGDFASVDDDIDTDTDEVKSAPAKRSGAAALSASAAAALDEVDNPED